MKSASDAPPWWQIVLGVEVVLLVIAVTMAITPGRAGSERSLAELFFDAPSLGVEVLAGFVLGNVVAGGLAIVFLATVGRADRVERDRESGE